MTTINRSPEFRLIDFKVTNTIVIHGNHTTKEFTIQMFGINESGKSASINVKGVDPFFFVRVGEDWDLSTVKLFEKEIYKQLAYSELEANYKSWQTGKRKTLIPVLLKDETKSQYAERNCRSYQSYHERGVISFTMVKRHKLYGFDNHKLYNFMCIKFKNTSAFNKIKGFWQKRIPDGTSIFGFREELKKFVYNAYATQLYEAKLPPLLRFFHIYNISPSGWIQLPSRKWKQVKHKKTSCDFECTIRAQDIHSLPNKETAVPIKICSFDIEASSSHGDFPVAIKTYKKLAGELQTFWTDQKSEIGRLLLAEQLNLLRNQLRTAFNFADTPSNSVSQVYPKNEVSKGEIDDIFNTIASKGVKAMVGKERIDMHRRDADIHDDEELYSSQKNWNPYIKKNNSKGSVYTLLDCLLDGIDVGKKVEMVDELLTYCLPPLEGDKVTFIGSTFMLSGEDTPYLNHGICLNTCTDYGDDSIEIVACKTEQQVLLEWTKVIQRERPDVIIGYNIFGFDYKFMCDRAKENYCFDEFCQLGKNKGGKM